MKRKSCLAFISLSVLFLLPSCGNSVASSLFSSSANSGSSFFFPSSIGSSASASSQTGSGNTSAGSASSSASASSDSSASRSEITRYSFALAKEGKGEVSGTPAGSYEEGTAIALSAAPDDGYSFEGYYENDGLLSSSMDYGFLLESNRSLVAVFKESNYEGTFSHTFKQGDFTKAGGTTATINGLAWAYSAFAYLGGATQGVQIGSANSPQTTAWTLSASFPDGIVVESYAFELCTAKSGVASYTVAFGDHSKTGDFSTTTQTIYSESGLSVLSPSFSLTLTAAAKAIYFNSLTFTVSVPPEIDFAVYADDTSAAPVTPGVKGIPTPNYPASTPEAYYSGLDLTLTGEALVGELRAKVSAMTETSYGDAKTMLQYTDEDPRKTGYDYGMWDGDDILAAWDSGASWNREHVWCCAQLQLEGVNPRPGDSDKSQATDLHNLRVACPLSNGYHGDKFFDETNTSTTLYPNIASGLNGHHAYSGDFRGDVARILFYMDVRYEGLVLDDALDGSDTVAMGKLSALLAWNEEDPVDAFETQRNDRIYGYQGNRNPFIDHPELADQIW